MNLLVATNLLKATKVEIDTALSGNEALKKLSENEYDLIFLDQMMPDLDGIETLHLAKEMPDNKNKNVPIIALTANAISGTREALIAEGFTDYLSKPIEPKLIEKMLMDYLPIEKLQAPTKENNEKIENVNLITDEGKYINIELGLDYSARMKEIYKSILEMFCNLKDEKKIKIQEAYDKGYWNNYATFVHALKSTSLSIGGEKLSEAARQLENAAKIIISDKSNENEKNEGKKYIENNHNEVMKLYDETAKEGKSILENDKI